MLFVPPVVAQLRSLSRLQGFNIVCKINHLLLSLGFINVTKHSTCALLVIIIPLLLVTGIEPPFTTACSNPKMVAVRCCAPISGNTDQQPCQVAIYFLLMIKIPKTNNFILALESLLTILITINHQETIHQPSLTKIHRLLKHG